MDLRIDSAPTLVGGLEPSPAEGAQAGGDFLADLRAAIAGVEENLAKADETAAKALVGDASPHEMVLAMSRADLSFRLMTQVRGKLVDAYREIMRMQL